MRGLELVLLSTQTYLIRSTSYLGTVAALLPLLLHIDNLPLPEAAHKFYYPDHQLSICVLFSHQTTLYCSASGKAEAYAWWNLIDDG
jgi:hypothetical protein